MNTGSKNSLAGVSTDRIMLVLFAFLIASVVALGVTYIFVAEEASLDKTYISKIGDQRVISQEIATLTSQATRGDLAAFPLLQKARDAFQAILEYQQSITPAAASSTMSPLNDLSTLWGEFSDNVDIILERREVVDSMRSYIQGIDEQIPALLALTDEVVDTMAKQKAPPYQVYIATRQLMLTQRISSNVGKVLEGGEEAVTAADRFGRDAALFGRVVQDMLRGNPNLRIQKIIEPSARKRLQRVAKQFYKIRNQVGAILERSPEMFQVSASAQEVLDSSQELHNKIKGVASSYQSVIDSRWTAAAASLFGILSLVFAVLVGFVYWRDSKMTLDVSEGQRSLEEETNTANQEAILRLLDEMGDLADGDLTVMATVTEDITGAIADSINYAIDALRSLVSAINETTLQVSSAAQQTQATAMHLAEASDHQAQQITGASTAINEMAVSIEGVSTHASELADEARKSVTMANTGSDAVQKTINGMDSIRETIQETSKRIKRLGESSQEIGDIVELINDIAEQTNILALNAAIQAAMAGDAGRGFAVVADEVQRLAERSADATKQIEALVKGIQSDTKEAVASMEQSTAGVVSGAQLAQDAGQALEQIETVSEHLADLIRNISESASQQANAASNISDTMNVIQEITTQTSAGTNETAASIGNLAELANELRRSVAGFKLPE
ncbi:type IV pilus biogenesis protein PilJ [hydrothermal vent metagenome]|uniref:Type IV pilus biogenesis protein PilJ n=1 Tax=hydrothermal vent metagenome TaxID=652676 RepID=A0A3B1AD67_9ZZZZ